MALISANRLNGVTLPDGTAIAYTYDANGQRASTSVTPPGGGAASVVNDYYQLGRLAYQTDGAGTLLASYTYDLTGAPVSVQVGSDPTSAPRYYYVYDARGDVVNLTDITGATVASYAYDTWGALTASSESIPNAGGWVNPYRYDGRDRVLADPTTGLDWLATRAYAPTTGRFLARDPLGRAPLFFADNPYAYAGNNPVSNVDPSGQYRAAGAGSAVRESGAATNRMMARVVAHRGTPTKGCGGCKVKEQVVAASGGPTPQMIQHARDLADEARSQFGDLASLSGYGVWGATAAVGVSGAVATACAIFVPAPAGEGCALVWARILLVSTALLVIVGAEQQLASHFSQVFSDLNDTLVTPDAWFRDPTNLTTLQAEMLAGITVMSVAVTAFVSLLSLAGATGLALMPIGIIGGLGIFFTDRALVNKWLGAMRTALGYA